MKKFLVSTIVFMAVIVSAAFSANTFAAGLGSQSVDVTVGEVDRIGTDEEQKDVDVPQTGIFGLNYNNDFIAASVVFTIPVTVFVVFLTRFCYLRIKRNRSIK